MIVSIIAAYAAPNRAIGRDGELPWRLPDDLARFRELTMGHTLLLGRRTFQSLHGRRLAGRRIIVLSRTLNSTPATADAVASSLEEGIELARDGYGETELFIAGGEQVYKQALDLGVVDRMYLTIIEAEIEGDTFFPPVDEGQWQIEEEADHPADIVHPYPFHFRTLQRSN